MRPLLLLGPTHPDPPDSRITGPDHVTFPGVSHIDHLLPREPQAHQSILEDSGIRLAVSQLRGNHDDLEELCQGGRAQLGFNIKSLAVRHQCQPVAFCKGLQHLLRLRVQAESLDREQAEKLRDRPGQVGRGSGARTLQEPAEELRGVDFRMPLRAPIQALLHDVKVDLTQLRGLDRGSSILEEGGQDLPEVVLPFVGFDIDDGQVEVKQDRLDRHLEDHTPAYFRGSLFYPRDAAFDHFTATAQDGIWRSPAQSLHNPPLSAPGNQSSRVECVPACRSATRLVLGSIAVTMCAERTQFSVDVNHSNFSTSVVVLVEWLARRKPISVSRSLMDRVILIPRQFPSLHPGGGHALPSRPNMSTSPCRGSAWDVIIGESAEGTITTTTVPRGIGRSSMIPLDRDCPSHSPIFRA